MFACVIRCTVYSECAKAVQIMEFFYIGPYRVPFELVRLCFTVFGVWNFGILDGLFLLLTSHFIDRYVVYTINTYATPKPLLYIVRYTQHSLFCLLYRYLNFIESRIFLVFAFSIILFFSSPEKKIHKRHLFFNLMTSNSISIVLVFGRLMIKR